MGINKTIKAWFRFRVRVGGFGKSAGLPACLIGRCCSCSVLGLYLFLCSLAARFCFVWIKVIPLLSALPSPSPSTTTAAAATTTTTTTTATTPASPTSTTTTTTTHYYHYYHCTTTHYHSHSYSYSYAYSDAYSNSSTPLLLYYSSTPSSLLPQVLHW